MAGTDSSKVIDFPRFEQTLSAEGFTKDQRGPLALRLQLLKSFLDLNAKTASRDNIFNPDPGSLTIVDLTDPFMDGSSACTFFDICLALFLENGGDGGRVFALDEAHKVSLSACPWCALGASQQARQGRALPSQR